MNDAAVSQALRLLRTAGLVDARKVGRIMHYRLVDDTVHTLLHQVHPTDTHPAPSR